METPSLPVLRPLRLGELLDQAIRLYRRNFITFIGIIALVYVPLMVLQTASATLLNSSLDDIAGSRSPEQIFSNYAYWGGMLSTIVIWFLQYIFVQGIAAGALARAVADNYLGKTASILDAYRGIGKSWSTLLGALLLVAVTFFAILLWFLVPCVGTFTAPGMIAFLFMTIIPFIAPVVVLEAPGPRSSSTDNVFERIGNWILRSVTSLRRVWSLARRRFWYVLLFVIILNLFNLLIVNGPLTIVNVILTQISSSFGDPTMQLVVTAIIQAIVSIVFVLIYYPLQMAAFTLIYFDLRVRTEGFDLVLLTMSESNLTDPTQAMAAPEQSNERLVTGVDLGNFAILALAAAGICIFFYVFAFGGIFFLSTLLN